MQGAPPLLPHYQQPAIEARLASRPEGLAASAGLGCVHLPASLAVYFTWGAISLPRVSKALS
jgi:hypothetical protein